MSKIKICGLKRIEDIQFVNELKPDYVGFVFAGVKRLIDKDTARMLKEHLDDNIPAIGVFINKDIDYVVDLVKNNIIDMVQLHGDEDDEYISTLKSYVDVPLIKAVKVRTTEDIQVARKLDVDYLLLDTYSPDGLGGTGRGFDRKLIPDDLGDYFLAGGLGPDNLEEVIKECHPFALDLSSSVETDGFKDRDKIKKVIDIVRNTK